MAIVRTRSRLTSSSSQTPPPSPIPTAKGSRSAADSIFSEYLNRSLKIPELTLPEYIHRSVPANIDRHSLASRETDSVRRLLRSAADFGVFRISRHGIRVEELVSALEEADTVFRISEDRKSEYRGRCEEFEWRRLEVTVGEQERKVIGDEKYRIFSQKMEDVANELEAIAGELGQVISESVNKQLVHKGIQPRESVLSLCRYNQDASIGESPPLSNELCFEHALSLHLLLHQCEFQVQSERGTLSFNTTPETIVVTVGKQLEEWSLGEFKSAYGELACEPKLYCSAVKLKCSPSKFNYGLGNTSKTISIRDQILFIIIVALLYKTFVFIFS